MTKDFQNTRLGKRLRGVGEIKDFAFPENCGNIGIRIDKNGVWYYGASPINREAIWKLFSSILQQDSNGNYWMITPYERIEVEVEDVPFMAIGVEKIENNIVYQINTGVKVTLDAENPIFLKTLPSNSVSYDSVQVPYISVRGSLTARLTRSVFYHTIDMSLIDDEDMVYLLSGGRKFILGQI